MKACKYHPEKRCYRSSCSVFDCVSGNVSVCPLFRGGDMFASRKVSPANVSAFSKHRHGGSLH